MQYKFSIKRLLKCQPKSLQKTPDFQNRSFEPEMSNFTTIITGHAPQFRQVDILLIVSSGGKISPDPLSV